MMLRSPALLLALFAIFVWFAAAALVPAALVVETLSALLLPISLAMLWRWGPGALRAFLQGAPEPRHMLTIAVVVMAGAITFHSALRLVNRWMGQPAYIVQSVWIGFPVYLLLISGTLYLLATRRDTDPPMKTLLTLVVIAAICILIAGIAFRAFT